jgi:hypothetical protein
MLNFNYTIIAQTSTLSAMFFASTIFITLVIARYATLAKLIRDSRTAIQNEVLKFKNIEEYTFHLFHFEKRLKLLRWTLYSALFSGVTLCMCLLLILVHLDTSALIFFVLHLILLMGALITLVYELAVSFEALTEHLDVMRDWKNKF